MYALNTPKVLDDYRLSSSSKILFSIILGILKEEKKVCVKDLYLADLMNASVRSIQRWLKILREEKYITTKIIASGTREIFVTKKAFQNKGVKNGIHN